MESDKHLLYEAPPGNQWGSHSETEEGRANIMSNEPRPSRRRGGATIRARKSPLTGEMLSAALDYYQVSKKTLARHSGVGESTVTRFCSGKADGDIPLWVERILFTYETVPWTRRVRGRILLPFRLWGFDFDDTDGESEDDVRARRPGYYGRSPFHRLRRAMQALKDITTADPEDARRIANEALSQLGPRTTDQPSESHEGATPAEPFGPEDEEGSED